jgi:hypothetical protein
MSWADQRYVKFPFVKTTNIQGQNGLGTNGISIGKDAGYSNQGFGAVAIGLSAGASYQGANGIAIGDSAGNINQGANVIAIGRFAGVAAQTAGSICLNASGVALNPAVAGCFINPVRIDASNTAQTCYYNTTTNEITYNTTVELVAGTASISPTIPITLLTGTTHSLASGTTIGQKKTIVNGNNNAFSPIFTNATQATGSAFIRCLKYDPALNRMYVGGDFTTIGGVAGTSRIAYYDYTAGTWNAMGGGAVSNAVSSIQISGTKVYASGNFNDMGGIITADNIAFWDTTTSLWTAMSPTPVANPSNASKLIISGNFLYMFGSFTLVNGVANTVKIAQWNITTGVWSAMGTGMTNNTITSAVVEGTNIWFCGSFSSAGGVANTTFLARWDTVGNTWNGYGASQVNNQIQTIQQLSPGFLVLVGSFTQVGTTLFLWSVLFNTSTNVFSFNATATNQNVSSFVDTDNTVWLLGNYQTLGNFSIGSEDYYYPTASRLCFYDTTINKWCPLFTTGTNNILAMERTNDAGEYWMVGDFTNFDGYSLTGLASLMKFNKNNLIKVNSNLLQNGVSARNSFGMTYKGQSIDLLNLDNSKWVVIANSPSTSTAPVVILY